MAKKISISVQIAPDLLESLDRMAVEMGVSRSAVVSILLNRALKEEETENELRRIDGKSHCVQN